MTADAGVQVKPSDSTRESFVHDWLTLDGDWDGVAAILALQAQGIH